MKLSVILPLLIPDRYCIWMTKFCIAALRTQAEEDFELVVVETGSRHFDPERGGPVEPDLRIDKYLHFPEKSTYVHDWNAGAAAASGEFLVHIGNDVFAGPGWDRALLEPFDRYRDCGVSCTSALEPGNPAIGHKDPLPVIVEGMWAPMMCFRKEWRLDPEYEGGYSDSDLIMRIYQAGLRAYRNYSSVAYHLQLVTWNRSTHNKGMDQQNKGEDLFYQRWHGSPWWMYSMIRGGNVQYGREHMAVCTATPPMMRGK